MEGEVRDYRSVFEIKRTVDDENAARKWREQAQEDRAKREVVSVLIGALASVTLEDIK